MTLKIPQRDNSIAFYPKELSDIVYRLPNEMRLLVYDIFLFNSISGEPSPPDIRTWGTIRNGEKNLDALVDMGIIKKHEVGGYFLPLSTK